MPVMSNHIDVSPMKFKRLPLELDYLPEELRIQAKNELSEDEITKNQSLKKLRELLEGEEGLCWQDDDIFLLAFLRVKKFDVNKAFNLIKGFYAFFEKADRLFYTMSPDRIKEISDFVPAYFLPYRDENGSVIFYAACGKWNPSANNIEEFLVCYIFALMQILRNPASQIAGVHLIGDYKGFGFKQLFNVTPSALLLISEMIQNAVPVRIRGLHAVNENSAFHYIWKIMKHFLTKKIRERVHLHGKDMKSLHKILSPSILPADLGGELPSFSDFDYKQNFEILTDNIELIRSRGYEKHLRKERRRSSIIDIISDKLNIKRLSISSQS